MIRELLICLELLVHQGDPAEIPTLRIADRFPNVELINQHNQSFASARSSSAPVHRW